MTESAIRKLYAAPKTIRVSQYIYTAGDKIEGTSKACHAYVKNGRLTFHSDGEMVLLETNDVVAFLGGDYFISIAPNSNSEVIWVWELPPGFE